MNGEYTLFNGEAILVKRDFRVDQFGRLLVVNESSALNNGALGTGWAITLLHAIFLSSLLLLQPMPFMS